MFIALSVSIEVVKAVRPILAVLRARCAELNDQLERSATSIPLNLAEGNKRIGKDRLHHFRIAAGSCEEARTAIAVAQALGHLDGIDLTQALAILDREAALVHRLLHPRR